MRWKNRPLYRMKSALNFIEIKRGSRPISATKLENLPIFCLFSVGNPQIWTSLGNLAQQRPKVPSVVPNFTLIRQTSCLCRAKNVKITTRLHLIPALLLPVMKVMTKLLQVSVASWYRLTHWDEFAIYYRITLC